jgi:hypothetical protein
LLAIFLSAFVLFPSLDLTLCTFFFSMLPPLFLWVMDQWIVSGSPGYMKNATPNRRHLKMVDQQLRI